MEHDGIVPDRSPASTPRTSERAPAVTIGEVVDFLRTTGLISRPLLISADRRGRRLTGIATDSAARKGDIAWLSANSLRRCPERLTAFRGDLLICPAEVAPEASPEGRVMVSCTSPRLAMVRVIQEFFAVLAADVWPDSASHTTVDSTAVIGDNVRLGPGVVIGPGCVLADQVSVGPNSVLIRAHLGPRTRIGANCSIGLPGFGYEKSPDGDFTRFPHVGGVRIDADVEIGSNVCIDRGTIGNTMIHEGAKIDNLVHIAHNVVIERNAIVIANSMLGGGVVVGEGAWVAPSVSVMNQASIGHHATLGLGAVVLKNVEAEAVMVGNPARPLPPRSK